MLGNKYQIHSLSCENNKISINWNDGHHSEFHLIWLRHQCECQQCGSPMDGIRENWILDIEENPTVSQISQKGNTVEIIWQQGNHNSSYDGKWLRRHCYSTHSRQNKQHHPILWDKKAVSNSPTFDLSSINSNKAEHLEMLETVRDFGFCRLDNMDLSQDGICNAAKLFGPVRMTHFGISELKEKPDQYNVGDSGRALLPHMDETYRISSVGITVFQMVQPSIEGGHSTLVDGFKVVRRLRKTDPEAYQLLSTIPVTFKRHHTGESLDGNHRYLVSRSPIIRLDAEGNIEGLRINERHISPLQMEEDLMEPFYRALRKLFTITYDTDLRIEFPLKSGQGMVFDNHRVLHGRTAFVRGEHPRHARSCNVDTEEFHSTMRLLQMELNKPCADLRIYQGV